MQMKYLSLALAAAVATTGLTACGSDSHDYWIPPTAGDQTPDAQTPETPETPDAETPDGETPDGETPDAGGDNTDSEVPPANPDEVVDNPGEAAEAGNRAQKSSVVGQQYIRGTNSQFDNTPATNDKVANPTHNANSTVVGFVKLQNDAMNNIVVARYADASNQVAGQANVVKYLLGSNPVANPTTTDENSLQSVNASEINGGTVDALVTVTKTLSNEVGVLPSYVVTGEESAIAAANRVNSNVTGVESERGKANFFGHLSQVEEGAFNSARYLVKNAENGQDIALTPAKATQNNAHGFRVEPLKLNNVQYGRVTGNLEALVSSQIQGKAYVVAKYADKDFNGNKDQTDVYFYRGLGETSLKQMQDLAARGGQYQYAGHALMYGIDNTYLQGNEEGGQSNSVAFGTNSAAVGNFVQATYDVDTQTVTGSIYNIWDTDTDAAGNFTRQDLVTFNGSVVGNSIAGSADRVYSAENDNASFKGSFYGAQAQEMGGAINSIKTTPYGESAWGGVFGAQQLPKSQPLPPVTPPEQPVPPINSVE